MLYNRRVTENITQLKQRIDAATDERDLLSAVRSVAAGQMVLRYRDSWWWAACGALFMMGLLALYLAYQMDYDSALHLQLESVLDDSSTWLPLLLVSMLAFWREEAGKSLPLLRRVNNPVYRFVLLALLVAALTSVHEWRLFYWIGLSELTDLLSSGYSPDLALGSLMIACALVVAFRLRIRRSKAADLSARISQMDAVFDNNLQALPLPPDAEMSALIDRFAEFSRGNRQRQITQWYEGKYPGESGTFPFRVYEFSYRTYDTQLVASSNGGTRSITTDKTEYRYGVLVDFPADKNMALSADFRRRFKREGLPGLTDEFNRIFTIQLPEDNNGAELLNAEVVGSLLVLADKLTQPVLEIRGQSLCLAVDDKDLLTPEHQYDLHNPQEFAREIAGHSELKKLQKMLALVDRLRVAASRSETV